MAGIKGYIKAFALTPHDQCWNIKVPGIRRAHVNEMGYQKMTDQAGSICDLAAYTVMRVGLGAARVKALEELKGSRALANNRGSVNRFKAMQPFVAFMTDWLAQAGHGVAQFKFDASSGAHTFAIERIPDVAQADPTIQIYQAYQGAYRLSDFLGLTSVDDFVKDKILAGEAPKFAAYLADKDKPAVPLAFTDELPGDDALVNKKWVFYQDIMKKSLARQTGAVGAASRVYQNAVSMQDFIANVLTPLSQMLGGDGADCGQYAALTGHATQGAQKCSTMLVMEGTFEMKDVKANFDSYNTAQDIEPGFIEMDA